MKKLILSTIFFLGITVTVFSQESAQRVQKSPEEKARMMTDMMDKKLSLTESQKTQIYQINLERATAISNFKADKNDTDRSQIKAAREAHENKILSILNESQKVTYNQLKAEREERLKKHRGDRKKNLKK